MPGDAVEVDHRLHGALAVAWFADDQAAPVILDRCRKDFRGRGRFAIDQDTERAVPGDAGLVVAFHGDLAAGVALLDDRPLVDEQASQFDRFKQRTTAVAAQVDQHAIDLFLLQFAEDAFDVARRALEVAFTLLPGLKVLVKGGQGNDADAPGNAGLAERNHRFLGGLFFQADLLAYQRHQLVLFGGAGIGRQDVEHDDAVGRAADQSHGVVEAPAGDVDDGCVFTLADADDAVAGLELARIDRRATGHQFADGGVFLALLQHGTDADQGKPHRNVEILGRARAEVVGVRLNRHGVGVHEDLEGIFALQAADPADRGLVALVQGLGDALIVLAGQFEAQPVVLDALAPEVVEFGFGGRPDALFAGNGQALVLAEIEAVLEQAARIAVALDDALRIEIENAEGGRQVLVQDGIVEPRAQRCQAVDIGLIEEILFAVQRLEITLKNLCGKRVVESVRLVVVAGKEFRGNQRGTRLLRQRRQFERAGRGRECREQ